MMALYVCCSWLDRRANLSGLAQSTDSSLSNWDCEGNLAFYLIRTRNLDFCWSVQKFS